MTTRSGLGPTKSDRFAGKTRPLPRIISLEAPTVSSRRAPIEVDRVRLRLEELKFPVATAALSVGLERNFIQDILTGRKQGINASNLTKLARALDCSEEYLTGQSNFVGARAGMLEAAEVENLGVVEPGACRPPRPATAAMVAPDPRHASLPQRTYKVGTNAYADYGIYEGQYVLCVEPEAWITRYGALDPRRLVVLEITRPNAPGVETVIRETMMQAGTPSFESLSREEINPRIALVPGRNGNGVTVEVVGVIVTGVRVF